MKIPLMKHTLEITALRKTIADIVTENSFTVFETDLSRPWGGFIRLENSDAKAFAKLYFPELALETYDNLSPKFLLVAPEKRLSWQKHARRAELWRVLQGPVGVKLSDTDDEPLEISTLQPGAIIEFETDIRHRLIGLDDWGIVTEIWKHADAQNLSDESDITRIQDDFGR